jgi:hypothetical protein
MNKDRRTSLRTAGIVVMVHSILLPILIFLRTFVRGEIGFWSAVFQKRVDFFVMRPYEVAVPMVEPVFGWMFGWTGLDMMILLFLIESAFFVIVGGAGYFALAYLISHLITRRRKAPASTPG